ncbi:hypothetical protein J2128_002477 [Methanomicrobium sp. W14]|uniref:hypothetical protein n=1 Tax=Methanomicrobium sp. W14 TaxID=2817839 RepID=UPI001AE19EF3|nr:hypothetical protein [Methanomicrobium sp. W14]MBP2134511.1 hypothetical protein [Methanomicrobium sp. W14]
MGLIEMLYSNSLSGYGTGSQKRYIYPEEYYSEECGDSLQAKLRILWISLFSDTNTEYLEQILGQKESEEYMYDSSSCYNNIEPTLLYLADYLGMRLQNAEGVIDYITKHPGMFDVVLYACLLACEEFNADSQVSLELYNDNESSDKYLTIYIRQEHYVDDIIEKMDSICDEYEAELADQSGWLLLTTDYKPPLQ